MALMRAYIDKRTLAALTTLDVATYAHGVGATPHAVFVRFIGTIATSTNWWGAIASVDVSNVTIQNPGDATGPAMEVCALRFHSIVQ